LWGLLAGIPGLSVVVPSTPADAAGLFLAAVDDPGPVVFLEHKLLSEQWLDYLSGTSRSGVRFDVPAGGARGEVEDTPASVPLGVAALRRQGGDLALVSLGVGVHRCVAPLDVRAVLDLARRTGRVLVVDEDYTRGGLSGEVAALLGEHGVGSAYARVTTEETIPYARALEDAVLPNVERIIVKARALAGVRAQDGG
jgi:pyruvate dehydrogenase E1 component beta subunit